MSTPIPINASDPPPAPATTTTTTGEAYRALTVAVLSSTHINADTRGGQRAKKLDGSTKSYLYCLEEEHGSLGTSRIVIEIAIMANDSPGETLATVGTPVEPQGVAHVGDHEAGSGGRDDEDVDKAVNQDPDSELHEKPGDQASNVLSTVKEPTSAPTSFHREGSKEDEQGGVGDAIPGISQDEMEQTTERIAKIATCGPSEQLGDESTNQESQRDRPAQDVEVSQCKEDGSTSIVESGNVIKHAESAQNDISMQDAPESAHKGSDLPDLATEDVSLSLSTNSGARATESESVENQAPGEQINDQTHQTTVDFNGQGDHVFVNLPNDIAAPSGDSQALSSYPHLQPSPVHPVYQGSQTVMDSVAPSPLTPAHSHIEARYPPNPLLPFPSVRMETSTPMSQAAMTDAILGLTFPFTSTEPTLPPPPQEEGRRIDAYVKLCFDDGNVYYIKNAAVVFGRAESSSRDRALNRTRNQRGGRGQKESIARGHQQKASRFKKAKSVASSASINRPRTPNNSRRTSIAMTTHTGLISSYNESARSFFTDPFTAVKPAGYPQEVTRTDEEALIHLPPTGEPARKNISRRHARLSFNVEKEAFELEVMGKNGAFVEEEWVECGSTWLLHKEGGHVKPSGEKAWRIQIGGVGFALIFPPRDPLENEKSGVAAAGKEGEEGMSLEFLDGSGREITTDFNEEEAEEEGDQKAVAEGDDEDEDEDDEGEDVDSDLEAEENAYALAPSAEDMSENDSLDGYEEDNEGGPPPVRGKSFINGYPAAFIERDEEGDEDEEDEEEDEEEVGDINNLDDDNDELDDEEGEEAEGDDGGASSSSEDEDDGDDYISGPTRKRKKPSPQRHKPIARKNIKMLEALKRPRNSPEPEKRGRGRPKKTVASKATKAVSKKPMKGPLKKQLTEQQRERERQKQDKARRIQELREREFRDRQERLKKLKEEEAEEARKRKELEKRDSKAQKTAKKQAREELLRERELLKEKQLRDALRSKALQKSLSEADKAEKTRQESERQEKRLLERQERLMREAREKEATAQAKRMAQEAAAESARKNARIQLPTILPPEASTVAPGTALAPLQLPTASASASTTSDAPKRSPGRPPKPRPDVPEYYQPSESPAPSGYYDYSHFPMDPSLEQFENPSQQRTPTHPTPHHSSMPGQYVPMKEPRQPKPPKEPKPKKEKPPPKRKRSPSPPINEADLPPEALLKPNSSYLILIHEAISNSEKKMLSLPDIYRAIQRKYPYFKLRVTTTGWQSSVRHNLSQSSAFERVQREGKGWLWKITDGFNIEKEKKKKLLPPPPLSQIIHPHYGQMVPVPNGMAPVPWNGMHGQQQGLPFQNGVYMAPPRPPGPVAAPGFPNQPQTTQGGSIQVQYPSQPTQYQQPQQHPTTPVPNAQPLPTPNNAPGANSSIQRAPSTPISTPTGTAPSSALRSAVPRAPIPPPPVSNATRIQMAQLASQRPQEQRLSQTPMPTQSPVTSTPPGKHVKIDKATLLAFKDIIDNAEKSQKEGGPQPMAGLNYNQLRTLIGFALDPSSPEYTKSQQLLAGALQLVQKGREQQVKPAQGQAIPAGKAPINSPQIQTVGPQVTGVQHPIAAQASNTSQHSPVHSPTITSNTPIVKALAMVNVPSPTPVANSTISAPVLAPTATQTPPTSITMAPQPKTVATPVSAPQPQAPQQPDAKPAAAPVPKATSQQLLNLLARLKAQKLAQQQAQGQVGQKAQGTSGVSAGSSSSPVPPSPVPQIKRPIDQISTATGSEMEKVTSDTGTEAHVAKKVDGGDGKQIEMKSECPVVSQASG